MWRIIQTDDFAGWYTSLDADAKKRIYENMEVLKELGPRLGRPYVDTVKERQTPYLLNTWRI